MKKQPWVLLLSTIICMSPMYRSRKTVRKIEVNPRMVLGINS